MSQAGRANFSLSDLPPWVTKGSVWIFLLLSLAATRPMIQFLVPLIPQVERVDEGSRAKWYNARTLQATSFGHWPAWVDWFWINILQDGSLEKVKRGQHPPMYYDMSLAVALDPRYYQVYAHGSNMLAVVRSDGVGAAHILELGEDYRQNQLPLESQGFRDRYWQRGWWLSLSLGYVYLFELDDLPSAAKSFRKAAAQAGSPLYLDRLAGRLERPGGIFEVGQRLLTFMVNKETDSKIIRELEKKKFHLQVMHYLHELDTEFLTYLRSQSSYRRRLEVSAEVLHGYWKRFKRRSRLDRDPWGGVLSLNRDGRIRTETPYDPVFGIKRTVKLDE